MTRDGFYLYRLMIGSSADEVDDALVVGETVGLIVIAHVFCHVNSDDLRMYLDAAERR